MAGTSTSQIKSAFIKEATPGTTPATPGFTTMHDGAMMVAKPLVVSGTSLTAKGQRSGHGILGIDVTGTLEGPLVYGVLDDWLESLLQGAWSADVLKNGSATKSLTVENTIPAGNGGTATMLRFRGVEATSGTLTLKAREQANLNLTLLGRGSDPATTTAIAGATYADPARSDPLSSGQDVGTIAFNTFTLDCMESLDINFAFEKREIQPKISSDDLCGITRGDFLPVLTANMYVESNFLAIYNAARATHSPFSVTVPLGSITGEKYTLVFPACHFGSTEIDMSGNTVMQKIEILPQYDKTAEATLIVTRAVA
ncbi:phage tail tube protein [Oceaniglobus ichthyenteri]|uniref:phage tail tube protein n=1 Tax=Oceaniglobus ichthyenteri TaxID=2136177 RepID=UPI000D3889FC|nr:phage tail tube protein [Oceaniglobus ichthyenteri]